MLPAMESTKVNLNLELELADGRISGLAGENGGAKRPFSGWLGLIGAIDALLGEESKGEQDHAGS
jgi:ABC-type uncharacterized transport system ATPase subunit